MKTAEMRPELESLPKRMRNLRIGDRGYPVPWFVAWVEGKPEFRVADGRKFALALREKRCWVCGEVRGDHPTFVIGPMCGINRTNSEPPCHYECARYSVRNCPFLSKPQMVRREGGMEEIGGGIAGIPIMRNPGVSLLWTTRGYTLFNDGKGGTLFNIGDPSGVEWWRLGRRATRAEVAESVRTGLPILEEMARQEAGAMEELHRRARALEAIYPKE